METYELSKNFLEGESTPKPKEIEKLKNIKKTVIIQTGKNNYEIDFLTTFNKKICPIEVKSSGYKNHSSIDKFSEKFSSRISRKILAYTKDVQKDGNVELLPVYMIQFL